MWIVRLALRRPYTFVVMSILIAILGFYFTDLRDFVPQDVVKAEAGRLQEQNKALGPAEAENLRLSGDITVTDARLPERNVKYCRANASAAELISKKRIESPVAPSAAIVPAPRPTTAMRKGWAARRRGCWRTASSIPLPSA